ncbi:hypothetical protein CEXT_672011 [Caerostris extrusa]|uniref:Uncharacterized protein n=1 Tax=Caerostris extrusa TaxID=172846 RepID=A0AAV4TXP9_CAEEX|nr:hypothetical protein CEXT_672011 [Caerostris extrusa]
MLSSYCIKSATPCTLYQGVADLISHFGTDFGVQNFTFPLSPIKAITFYLHDIIQRVLKAEGNDKVLKLVAYENVDTLYPISQ